MQSYDNFAPMIVDDYTVKLYCLFSYSEMIGLKAQWLECFLNKGYDNHCTYTNYKNTFIVNR